MAAYVIKSWGASDRQDVSGNYVAITGRKEGIISWILALIRIQPTVSITVSESRIEFSQASLSGSVRRMIPLTGVCSTLYGYYKPWKQALLVFLILVWIAVGIGRAISSASGDDRFAVGALPVGIVIGVAISVLYYFQNRTLTLGFVENSGIVSAIQFKRSIIEGQDIDEANAEYVCQLVQFFCEARQRALLQGPAVA